MLNKLFLFLILFSHEYSYGQTKQNSHRVDSIIKNRILSLDRKIQQAVVIGDTALINSSIANDFVFTHGLLDGEIDTKTTWKKLAKAKIKTYVSRDVDSATVELHNNIAIVVGRLNVKARFEEENKLQTFCYSLHFIHVYAKRKDKWLFISHKTAKMVVPEYKCK
ncbi:MAG TPA: nuclear transport factor 2 family protein [Chitinophagaceae bacterium]|jgi:hypothetical protein|nr:nuclear transport factor 2 family protein [Chitinophagaceae bacterium]